MKNKKFNKFINKINDFSKNRQMNIEIVTNDVDQLTRKPIDFNYYPYKVKLFGYYGNKKDDKIQLLLEMNRDDLDTSNLKPCIEFETIIKFNIEKKWLKQTSKHKYQVYLDKTCCTQLKINFKRT